jgi:2-oxoglutarate ferredoxin oxidoreductase subunit beta
VFRDVDRPAYDDLLAEQITAARGEPGAGDLEALLSSGDAWTIS